MSSTLACVTREPSRRALAAPHPNALIIGAMKSSTTLLFDTLGLHPRVFTPATKEPHFFSSPDRGSPEAWERYLRLFAGARPCHSVILEASTTYTRWPENGNVAPAIETRLGSPRLIYILRDPVERAASHYAHSFARGFYPSTMTFGEAIRSDPVLLSASRYASQLERYDEVFGPDATLVLFAEDLHTDRAGTMARVAAHLGLDWFEGWSAGALRANAAENVRSSAPWQPLLDRAPLLREAARRLPPGLRRRIKSLRAPAPQAPAPTPIDRAAALHALRDDIIALEARVGPLVRRWPSASGLRTTAGSRAALAAG